MFLIQKLQKQYQYIVILLIIVIYKIFHKLLDHAKQSTTDVCKTSSKRAIQTTVEATDDLIGNKIKLQETHKLHHRIIYKQMKKYLGKNIYVQI